MCAQHVLISLECLLALDGDGSVARISGADRERVGSAGGSKGTSLLGRVGDVVGRALDAIPEGNRGSGLKKKASQFPVRSVPGCYKQGAAHGGE